MASPKQLIYQEQNVELPADYTLPPGLELMLQSIVAHVDGAGAADSFRPALAIYAQSGQLMARVPVDQIYAPGDSGVVTWAPFLRSAQAVEVEGGLLDFAWLSWDYQLNGFAPFVASDGVLYGWESLPLDGFNGFSTDPSLLLPSIVEDPPGTVAGAALVTIPTGFGPTRVLHVQSWIAWDSGGAPSFYFWEHFSGSPQPPNALIRQQIEYPQTTGNLVTIAFGEPGDIRGGFKQDTGGDRDLLGVGVIVVRFNDYPPTPAGTDYPPW